LKKKKVNLKYVVNVELLMKKDGLVERAMRRLNLELQEMLEEMMEKEKMRRDR
jgi:hypothetical protein